MPTIHDVSKLAGVGVGTVSRVLNNRGYVDQDTRARVNAAIAELGYMPNRLAGSLRSKSTGTIALVLSDIENPFWAAVTRGTEDCANERQFNIILCNADDSEGKQLNYLTMLLEKKVDGIVLVPGTGTNNHIAWIQKQGTKVVVLDRHLSGYEVDTVRGDSVGGSYELVKRLISAGHRRIGMVSGPENVSTSIERVEGYKQALIEAGIEVNPELIYYGKFERESGLLLTQKVLALSPRPSAIFAANNRLAMGAYNAIQEVGMKVPEDISMVAFDDLPPDHILGAVLTIAAQPAYEMGRRATNLLLDRIRGQAPREWQDVVLPTQIIERKSIGKPTNNQ
jgi:LacI family transcriptional regulator